MRACILLAIVGEPQGLVKGAFVIWLKSRFR
jgi:hypothetical protein